MSTQIILKVLALRQRDRWTRQRLEEHQARALRYLREHTYARSPFYGRFHEGFTDRPLDELPVLTKETVMEHFDEQVTDPTVRLADVEGHLATLSGGDELFNGRYRVASTSGSTGRRGHFLWDPGEWAAVLASYNRSFDWAGVGAGLTHRTRMAVVSSTTPWHQSARVGASVHSPWVPTLRLDSGDPLESVVERLNAFRPRVLVAYASMAHLLAEEQLAGRLRISPGFVFGSSEVFTDKARRRVEEAWGRKPFEVYAATEPAGIASECEQHRGMHLFEDLVITEVVDDTQIERPRGGVLMSRRAWIVLIAVSGAAALYRDRLRTALKQTCANVRAFDLPSAGMYDALVASALEGFYARVASEVAAAHPGGKVLEVGSGPGRLAVRLAQEAPGTTMTGVDISDAMVGRAARRVEVAGLGERVRFDVADVAALPFPDREFDGVVSTLSLHHWPDPARGLAEIYRVLEPGGEARIYDLAHWLWPPARGGDRLARIAEASPFGGGEVEIVRWPGFVPAFVLLRLRRARGSVVRTDPLRGSRRPYTGVERSSRDDQY